MIILQSVFKNGLKKCFSLKFPLNYTSKIYQKTKSYWTMRDLEVPQNSYNHFHLLHRQQLWHLYHCNWIYHKSAKIFLLLNLDPCVNNHSGLKSRKKVKFCEAKTTKNKWIGVWVHIISVTIFYFWPTHRVTRKFFVESKIQVFLDVSGPFPSFWYPPIKKICVGEYFTIQWL